MGYCFHMVTFLCLVIFQTTLMPYFYIIDQFYDIIIPFILYIAFCTPAGEGIFIVLLSGFVMDNLSGGYFGFYTTIYLWLFICARSIVRFLHVGNSIIIPFAIGAGVLVENLIFSGLALLFETGRRIHEPVIGVIAVQVLWAVSTGPFLFLGFRRLYKKWDHFFCTVFTEKNGKSV